MNPCHNCGAEVSRVIYYGLPHRLCVNENCNSLTGRWLVLTGWLPFNGALMVYPDGPPVLRYLRALYQWLRG